MSKISLLLLFAFIGLASCARPAINLPTDTTSLNKQHVLSASDFSSSDLAMDCKAIADEKADNAAQIDAANEVILGNRQQNEVAGYLGSMLLLPYAATKSNDEEKDKINALSLRQDVLLKLAAFKNCPAA